MHKFSAKNLNGIYIKGNIIRVQTFLYVCTQNSCSHIFEPSHAKTKTQISFAETAKLISAFVFATGIAQFLFLNLKFQASNLLLW